MADVHGPTATRTTSWHWSLLRDSVPHEFPPSEAADLRDRPKHRSSCSMAKEDRAAATVMFGSALPAIDPLPNRSAISKAPRAAASPQIVVPTTPSVPPCSGLSRYG